MERILFITSNEGKLREASEWLEPSGFTVEAFIVDGKTPELIEPQAPSLEGVATSKITQAQEMVDDPDVWVMVEDSGLFIDELGSFPGVFSAHVYNSIGLDGILKLMHEVNERGAEFQACCVIAKGKRRLVSKGVCRGRISHAVRGENGFGYDPLFIPDDDPSERTFAEMTSDEKGEMSHRTRALKGLVEML